MGHHSDRAEVVVLAGATHQADEVAGLVDPHLIHQRLEFAAANVADGVFLANRAVCRQQFLQQRSVQPGCEVIPLLVTALIYPGVNRFMPVGESTGSHLHS